MMPSTSRSNRRKSKSKFVQKPKQQWRVKEQKKNWLELPSDIIFNILNRVGVYDILENAQKVCTIWRKICKDPAMWRVIYMDNHSDPCARPGLQLMCKQAVDRSQGQLTDLTLIDFATHELLLYISERSSQLKRLDISYCFGEFYDGWTEVLKKFPLLEEFSLSTTDISKEDLEGAGYSCPMLTTLKINQKFYKYSLGDNEEESLRIQNENAIAIGKNFPNLIHLEIIGNTMSNTGLQVILEGCNNLESLDLRQCLNVDLEGDIVKKGLERIKCLKLPNDSLEGLPFSLRCHVDLEPEDLHDFEDDFDDDLYDIISHDAYDEYLEYDDYTNPYLFDYIHNVKPDLGLSDSDEEVEELNNMLAFMAFFG